jgi:hypothetical protein
VIKFLLWCLLFVLCWPLALFALVLYPVVWLLLLPFRLAGIAVHGALDLVAALILLPARHIRAVSLSSSSIRRRAAEGVARVHVAALKPALEPVHALLRGAMGEAVRRDVALRHLLQMVVADGSGCL